MKQGEIRKKDRLRINLYGFNHRFLTTDYGILNGGGVKVIL